MRNEQCSMPQPRRVEARSDVLQVAADRQSGLGYQPLSAFDTHSVLGSARRPSVRLTRPPYLLCGGERRVTSKRKTAIFGLRLRDE